MTRNIDMEKLYVPVAIVVLAIAVVVSANMGASTDTKAITTTGNAEIKVAPDKVTVSFGIETEALTAAESQDQNREISNRIMEEIQSLGILSNEVQTTQLTVQPITEFDPETREFVNKGFKTTHIITVSTSSIGVVGELIDTVVGVGANRVDNIVFSLSENKERELRKQLLDDAAAEAKSKAEAIASGIGASIIGVKSASESSFIITPFFASAELKAGGAPTQVASGEIEVTASVSVSFQIL